MTIKRIVGFKMDLELLREWLHLPANTRILDVRMAEGDDRHCVVYVTHPDLPEVDPAIMPPLVTPVFHHLDDGTVLFCRWDAWHGDRL